LQLTKSPPTLFFKFLESVERLQPTTACDLCSDMGEGLGRVRAAKIFAETYDFSKSNGERDIFLLDLGARLLRYSGNARIDFLVHSAKLQDKEPLAFLREQLERSNSLPRDRIANLLRIKFGAPKSARALDYAKSYGDWLVELRFAKWNNNVLEYIGGKVRSLDIVAVDEANKLLDSTVYDWITESFSPYQEMNKEPLTLLSKVGTATDDNLRGELFEKFVASVFRRLGFSTRTRDGVREARLNLTYQRPGGGDIAAFCHFPTIAGGVVRPGFALACEAKSTEGTVGSTAVGQVRNLAKKIGETFPNYVVQSLVVSRSRTGYDSSGREQAPPEVVHFTADLLLKLLDLQLERVQKSSTLITPLTIILAIDDLVKTRNLEPDWKTLSNFLLKHL